MFFFDHARRAAALPGELRAASLAPFEVEITNYLKLPPEVMAQTDVPTSWKDVDHRGDTILTALAGLSHQRCAFCDRSRVSLQIYRFRPPGYAEPMQASSQKGAYVWLALHWENMFPICEDCLPDNPAHFPVRGQRAEPPSFDEEVFPYVDIEGMEEDPVLIYPGELDTPWKQFDIKIDGTLVAVRSSRANQTIKQFKLNRPDLVESRRDAIRRAISDLGRERLNDLTFAKAKLGGALYLFYRRLVQTALSLSPTDPRLEPDKVLSAVREWMQSDTYIRELEAAVQLLGAGWTPPKRKASKRLPPMLASEAPRLSSVTISNYKSIESMHFAMASKAPSDLLDHQDEDATPCMLVIGENAAGKSSILEAVAIASLSEPHLDALKLKPNDLVLDPQLLGSPDAPLPRTSTITLEFENGARRTATIDRVEGKLLADAGSSVPPLLVFAYGARRLYESGERSGMIRHVDTLFDYGKYISNPERWLVRMAERSPLALDEVISALRHVIEIDGTFESIERRKDKAGNEDRCYVRIRRPLDDGGSFILEQRLDVASSGYRAVLALICDVLAGLLDAARASLPGTPSESDLQRIVRQARKMKAIVLIDEVEAHMHPRWKLNVLRGLRRALPGVTFIVTSHDPLCVRGMGRGEIMLVNRYVNESGKGLQEAVEQTTDLEDTEQMTVEQLLTSQLFQLLSTDDIRMDRRLNELSAILSHRDQRAQLSVEQNNVLSAFEQDVIQALPFGRTEATQLIQKAIAHYLETRRTHEGSKVAGARAAAEKEIYLFLDGLLS